MYFGQIGLIIKQIDSKPDNHAEKLPNDCYTHALAG